MILPIQVPLTTCIIPLLREDIDPSYFWFIHYSFGSPPFILSLRIVIFFIASLHGSLVVADILISLTNVAQTSVSCFKTMSTPKLCQRRTKNESETGIRSSCKSKMSQVLIKLGNSAKFPKYLLKYRQLTILVGVSNQAFYYIIPAGLFISLFNCTVSVYFLIKLSLNLPLVVSLFSILEITLVFIEAHGLIPMFADITEQSEKFISFWKQQGHSALRKRQLDSCRPLGFWVGPFFVLAKSTRVNYLELVLYYAINLIISV